MNDKKVTVLDVQQAKEQGRKLVMVTAYDYPLGLLADEAGVDIVLVGDSLGMVVLGMEGTVEDVKFPGPEHSFKMPDEALKQLKKMIAEMKP